MKWLSKIFKTGIFSRLFAVLLGAVLIVLSILAAVSDGVDLHLLEGVGLAFLAGVFFLLKKPGKILGGFWTFLVMAVSPFLAVWLLQLFTADPARMYPKMLGANCVFFYLIYFLLTFVLGSFAAGYAIAGLLAMVVGIANYFVVQFRGSPIVPWDLFSIKTAASVADNYTYTITWKLLLPALGFVFLILAASKMTWKIRKWQIRLAGTALFLAALLVCVNKIQDDRVKDWLGMDQTLFTPGVRYRNNGFLAAFLGNLDLINIKEPDGYSPEAAEAIAAQVTADADGSAEASGAAGTNTQMPNIIVIMNEAFSDLAVLGEFGVDKDYMPNFRRLMEEYAGGQLMVSVKGGNTANTEYEFLSGDTMAFLPAGSVVFQQFIHDDVPALPSYLKSLGYETTGIHPYLAGGWDRDKVYPRLGFETFVSKNSFKSPLILRKYISDQSAFDKIIEEFEAGVDKAPQFIFEVTMQNHGGYSAEFEGFEELISLTKYTEKQKNTQIHAAQKYLTLIYESDRAFGKLIEYFETVKEPVIIVMFGDHEPSDYVTNVIKRITGYDPEASLKELQRSYIVPYVVWNNFGMEFGDYPLTSVNYFGADLLKAAGLPLTAYQQFLLSLQEQLPVICAGAYIDADGNYYTVDERDNAYGNLLNNYNILQYNHLTDRAHRVLSVFS